ncbi:hypothetical protein [Stenotrophomonas rhizophila]|uniref:hypothetical protein n=1 Tax=Stenotrophomonas rhizophila TaxID=216778 RepID=UPI000F4C1FA8|nr:hypothetical protein [Stenotrophomonas rhizophila]
MKYITLSALVLAACATTATATAAAAPAHELTALHPADIAARATTVVRGDLVPGHVRPVQPLARAQADVRLPTVVHTHMLDRELQPARPVDEH